MISRSDGCVDFMSYTSGLQWNNIWSSLSITWHMVICIKSSMLNLNLLVKALNFVIKVSSYLCIFSSSVGVWFLYGSLHTCLMLSKVCPHCCYRYLREVENNPSVWFWGVANKYSQILLLGSSSHFKWKAQRCA